MSFIVLHPKEIEHIRKQKNAIVVDVRERTVYQQFHYPNAVSLPYEEKDCWCNHFNKRNCYILYCQYGSVSLLAARKLGQAGISVYTVVGGIEGIKRYNLHFKD